MIDCYFNDFDLYLNSSVLSIELFDGFINVLIICLNSFDLTFAFVSVRTLVSNTIWLCGPVGHQPLSIRPPCFSRMALLACASSRAPAHAVSPRPAASLRASSSWFVSLTKVPHPSARTGKADVYSCDAGSSQSTTNPLWRITAKTKQINQKQNSANTSRSTHKIEQQIRDHQRSEA